MNGLEKGSEEWLMWQDIFKFRKRFYEPQDNEKWWKEFTQAGIDLGEKYNEHLAAKIVVAIMDYTQEKYGKDKQK